MSYYRRDSQKSDHLVDRLPVYVFPAFVGSGRILLGMALAGLTTALLMKHSHELEPMMWWLAVCAYLASLLLAITGVYSINYIPPKAEKHAAYSQDLLLPPRPVGLTPISEAPVAPPPPDTSSGHTHLGDLLVDRWRIITREQLATAQQRQEESGRSLVQELAQLGLLTDEQLEHVLEVQAEARDPWYGVSKRD